MMADFLGSLPLRSTAQSLSSTSLSNQTVRLIDEALNWCADSGAVEVSAVVPLTSNVFELN